MLTKVLILLVFCDFLSCSVPACESQCVSLLLNNLIDKTESSIVVALIKNAQNLLDDADKFATMEARCPNNETALDKLTEIGVPISAKEKSSVEPVPYKPMDCAEILERNRSANSGVYSIWPRNRMMTSPINVYCDMEDDGGAWTVLQRRGDFGSGKDYFYKDWKSYKSGFGDLKKDFWLGNDNIFALTNQRANVVKFTLTDWEGNTTYAIYEEFWIDDEHQKYRLHASGYNGTAGDSLAAHNGQAFSTKDQDNDKSSNNCAVKYKGAWWYYDCYQSSLNGYHFSHSKADSYDGVIWSAFKGSKYSLKNTVIKVRPKDFKNSNSVEPH